MRKLIPVLAIIGLLMVSQTTARADGGFYIPTPGEVSIDGATYRLTFDAANLSATEPYMLPSLTATWEGALVMGGIYTNGYRWGFSVPSASPAVWTPYLEYMYPYYTIPAGGSIEIILEWTNYGGTAPTNISFNGQNPTSEPTPTPTPYGASTATPTPTPTATPRPWVEATAVVQMEAARDSISSTLDLDNLTPYDWRGGSSFNFPNLFDGIIAPYMGTIIRYMLALMEIVNTNGVVVVIFVLSMGISILMIVIKMVSGGALNGWQSTGIKDAVDNPYRTLDRKR